MDIEEARRLVEMLANLPKDGEPDPEDPAGNNEDGHFMWENDAAWEAIHNVISWARKAMGMPEDHPDRVDAL